MSVGVSESIYTAEHRYCQAHVNLSLHMLTELSPPVCLRLHRICRIVPHSTRHAMVIQLTEVIFLHTTILHLSSYPLYSALTGLVVIQVA
jgi:hypothetical protein